MDLPGTGRRRIEILPPAEARKIAAGEVIDRPAALVREFLDNAIDCGASVCETVIEGGGIQRAEVIDDGSGMSREDLELCFETHATSKIRSLEDLNSAETLGFRGEALAAAAAVSRLEILSSEDGRGAWLLETGPGGSSETRLTRSSRVKGSSVRALRLFDTIPARKRFLKREGSEAQLCRQVFIEKALAFPALNFRFIQDGKLKCGFSPANSYKERFAQALLDRAEAVFLREIAAGGPGFSAVIVAGGPELYRSDRRQQYCFANGRRIQDFSLIQAFEYGLQHWFPNGTHPVGAVFIDIDPSLADFNIHPAKREARFHDPGAIHHAITSALGDYARRSFAVGAAFSGPVRAVSGNGGGTDAPSWFEGGAGGESVRRLALEALEDNPAPFPGFRVSDGAGAYVPANAAPSTENTGVHGAGVYGSGQGARGGGSPEGAAVSDAGRRFSPESGAAPGGRPRLAGRVFSLFILVEWADRLFIIDQHAAHERLLYDRVLAGKVPAQELLVPIPFATDGEEGDRFLEKERGAFSRLGIRIEGGGGSWRISALPESWKLSDTETVREILELRKSRENMAERWAATLSCHGAVKDGDYLDDGAALALAEAALRLPVPRCPHGRPIWKEISREDLFRAVRRIE
ncbi:MAG: DNA mismatch repair endonuclease MutL [Spirochaetaceae bacterium]|jgi:DNA mismatch repair protein MutL|nr:DNA mismatch repair endonuclease MutL [Spirochaetaceae bacterium]